MTKEDLISLRARVLENQGRLRNVAGDLEVIRTLLTRLIKTMEDSEKK